MADVDEKQMREMYDRLHAIERQQSDADRKYMERMGEIEKQAALDRANYLNSISGIKDMLQLIIGGKTENCLVHKAELDVLRNDLQRERDSFLAYRTEQAMLAEKHEAALQHRSWLIWGALVSGGASFLWKLVPWIAKALVANGG